MKIGGSEIPAVLEPRAGIDERLPWSIRRSSAILIELIIAGYSLALVVIFAAGGLDWGVVHLNDATKPILVLLIVVPLRLTLDEPWWLLEPMRHVRPAWLAGMGRAVRVRVRVAPDVADVAFALAATRAASVCVGFIANLLFVAHTSERPFAMPFRNQRFVETFAVWDSGWYFGIAKHGYYFNPDGQSSIAFFPAYPLLMRAVAWPFGGSDKMIWISGIAVSWVAFALALIAVHRLTRTVIGEREAARRAVLYMAVFPFSLFFTRVYAESVFLLATVLAVSRGYDGRWWRAGLWGALATLARPNGIVIGLPLGLMALADRAPTREVVKRGAALLPIPVALAGYCAYAYTLSGDPLAWLSAQVHWGYSLFHPPWEQLAKMIGRFVKYGFYDYFFVSPMAAYRLFHGVVALIFLGLTPAIFKRLGAGMGAYVLVSLIVPLTGNALEGIGRYSAVLFPAFMLLGSFKSQRLHEAILLLSALFLALFICLFVTGRPIY